MKNEYCTYSTGELAIMGECKIMIEVGAETARRKLPELLNRAYKGEQTIIKKRGVPYAAIVALDQRIVTKSEGLLALRATGKGLWGNDSSKKIAQYRDEWE